MAEYAGSAMYLAWVYSGGTVVLDADARTFDWTPTLNFIDATAGKDTFENILPSYGVGGDFSAELLAQTDGTVLITALARQTLGTLVYGPEGTVTGKIRYTIPAFSEGPQWSSPFDDVTTITANWRQNAAEGQSTF